MKKLIQYGGCSICVIIMIVALLFVIIEGRLLFSGDWLIYEFAMMGALRYFCRLLIALSVLLFTVSVLWNMKQKNDKLKQLQKDVLLGFIVILAVAFIV